MAKAITQMARACLHCQRGKVHRHIHLQPAEIPVPHRRFAHIHVDLVGPLPPSRSHTYLFTIIDRTSRWPEAIPLASITAADCTRALFAVWVSQFGVQATITSDRGAQFTSALWAGLCNLLNVQHSPTTAYHPQSNGLVERFHRRLKDALRSRAAAADWHNHVPWVLLGIGAAYREDSEFSPAEAVYGSQLILPGQFINTAESPSPSFLSDLQTKMTARHRRHGTTQPQHHQHCLRSCCWPASSWSAGTAHNRCCHLSTTAPTECWSGQHTSSCSRWGIEPTRCPRSA
jgi:hypothetical protein